MTGPSEIIQATVPVVKQFQQLGVAYYLGGSVASSIHGIPRSTLDVDLIAAIREPHIADFVEALVDRYYVSASMIRQAITDESCFNVIFLETMFKVDVFVAKSRPFDQASLSRIGRSVVGSPGERIDVWVASPEDVVLNKLEWYRKADRISERQWLDVQGVLKVQRELLDLGYMRKWAGELDIADLLEEALSEAGIADTPDGHGQK